MEDFSEDGYDLTYDQIDMIKDSEMFRIAKRFNIKYMKHVQFVQELKLAVTKGRQANAGEEELEMNEEEFKKQEKKRREILKEYGNKLQEIIGKLKPIFEDPVKFVEKIEELNQDFLLVKSDPIFITGEISTGKSSLVNLLLKDEVMPTKFKRNTGTFCTVSKAEKRSVIVHLKNGTKIAKNDLTSEECKMACKEYLQVNRDDVEKVELKCPSKILDSYGEIMDSPGMGDECFDEYLAKKLEKACAIVYMVNPGEDVIPANTTKLAKIVKSSCQISSCLIFIVNKWDEVFENKVQRYENICQEIDDFLKVRWSRSRIIPMSVRDAKFMQDNDVIADDYADFLRVFRKLKVSGITNKTLLYYRCLVKNTNQIIESLDILQMTVKFDKKIRFAQAENLDFHRSELKDLIHKCYESQKNRWEEKVREISVKILYVLRNENYDKRFIREMSENYVPSLKKQELKNKLTKRAAEKLSNILSDIEDKYFFIKDIINEYMKDVFIAFSEIKDRIEMVKHDLIEKMGESRRDVGPIYSRRLLYEAYSAIRNMSITNKIIFGVSIPLIFPFIIGATVIAANVDLAKLLSQKINFDMKPEKQKSYVRENACKFFREYISKDTYILEYVKDNMDIALSMLEEINATSLYELSSLENYAKCLRQTKTDDADFIYNSNQIIDQLKSHLADLFRYEFECLQYEAHLPESIFRSEDPTRSICKTTTSEIHNVIVTAPKDSSFDFSNYDFLEVGKQMALKRIIWTPIKDSVPKVLEEMKIALQNSKHPGILKMLAVVKSSIDTQVNVYILCEAVEMSLRSHIRQNSDLDGEEKFQFLYRIFDQVQEGLRYLHSVEIKSVEPLTAYDLSLDTLMITTEGRVKIMNITPSKHLDITNVMGQDRIMNYRHLSPKVILLERKYDPGADFYSFAIAQFEAWWQLEAYQDFIFDKNVPIDSLKTFAVKLNSDRYINRLRYLQGQIEISVSSRIQFRKNKYDTCWYEGIRDILDDYKRNDLCIMREGWKSYFRLDG